MLQTQVRLIWRGQLSLISPFVLSFSTLLNDSALGLLKQHYITKRIRELLIGNSRFLKVH